MNRRGRGRNFNLLYTLYDDYYQPLCHLHSQSSENMYIIKFMCHMHLLEKLRISQVENRQNDFYDDTGEISVYIG